MDRRTRRRFFQALVAAIVAVAALGTEPPRSPAAAPLDQGAGTVLATWVQLGPAGTPLARAVTDGATCPDVVLNGQARAMQARGQRSANFPVLVCELAIPAGTTSATIGGQQLPLPRVNPQRIAITGDTGCRIEPPRGTLVQDCNDPEVWPFVRIAQQIAAVQPDLVIHVGDVNDRDGPCPGNNPRCVGRPGGDNWPAWLDDFFVPAAPFLRVAPIVILRGNHEECSRNGRGWFLLLDPHPFTTDCSTYSDPYSVPLGSLQLLVLDSASAPGANPTPDQVAAYRPQIDALRAVATDPSWFVTHKGVRIIGHSGEDPAGEVTFRDNPTLQAAGANDLPAAVKLTLSGHVHFFQALEFAPPRPPQLVGGFGGDLLDAPVTSALAGLPDFDTTVARGTNFAQYGFTTVVPTSGGWSFTVRNVNSQPLTSCLVQDFHAPCAPPLDSTSQPQPPPSGQAAVPCTTQIGGPCAIGGATTGRWTKTGSGTFSVSATGPLTTVPNTAPLVFLPTTVGMESVPCSAVGNFPPFATICQGSTRGDLLAGATVTVRFAVAGGGATDVTGSVAGTAPSPPIAPPALAQVPPSGQPGVPCADALGSACLVAGAVTGRGLITGSMAWSLTASAPAGAAAGRAPLAVLSTSTGLQTIPCTALAAGAPTVSCTGATPGHALQRSLVTVLFGGGLTATGTVIGPGPRPPLPPPPPIVLPPPPPPPIVPVLAPPEPGDTPTSPPTAPADPGS